MFQKMILFYIQIFIGLWREVIMHISKVNVFNYRLLNQTSVSCEKDLSLIIGKNNCGIDGKWHATNESCGQPFFTNGWERPGALCAKGGPPPVGLCSSIFYVFHKKSSKSFIQFRELLILHKKTTMVVLLKTTPIRVIFINHANQSPKQEQNRQEKQIRWKRINSPKLNPLLVLKQFN